jgi:hypothetical protein
VKTLTVTLIAGIALAQFGVSVGATPESTTAHDLVAAKCFALGGIGAAGLMSEGERKLRSILERPDASQQLQAALTQAMLEGKLYILVGLRRCDPAAYRAIFGSLLRLDSDVEVGRGCIISREPFRQLLSQIHDGRFDGFLSRQPW